jgi:hypothetical protein
LSIGVHSKLATPFGMPIMNGPNYVDKKIKKKVGKNGKRYVLKWATTSKFQISNEYQIH